MKSEPVQWTGLTIGERNGATQPLNFSDPSKPGGDAYPSSKAGYATKKTTDWDKLESELTKEEEEEQPAEGQDGFVSCDSGSEIYPGLVDSAGEEEEDEPQLTTWQGGGAGRRVRGGPRAARPGPTQKRNMWPGKDDRKCAGRGPVS